MTLHPTAKLTIHPVAAALPMPAHNSVEAKTMIASIGDIGITYPLQVCKGRIVDGRLRHLGAVAVGLAEVPVREVEEKDVTSIVLHTLLARTHYTKSALAYIGYPILEPALAESRKRRLGNLKMGGDTGKCTPCTIGNTAEELAESLGVSRRLFFMARDIHKKFASNPRSIRDTWEPKILSGELSLGEAQQAIAGKIAALEGNTTPKGDAQQLLFELFKNATVRFGRWSSLNASQRQAAADKFLVEFLPSLPTELLEITDRFIAERLASK